MLSCTTITVSARSDLEIERTVHSTIKTQITILTYPLLYHTHGLSDQPSYVNLQVKRHQIFDVEKDEERRGCQNYQITVLLFFISIFFTNISIYLVLSYIYRI